MYVCVCVCVCVCAVCWGPSKALSNRPRQLFSFFGRLRCITTTTHECDLFDTRLDERSVVCECVCVCVCVFRCIKAIFY